MGATAKTEYCVDKYIYIAKAQDSANETGSQRGWTTETEVSHMSTGELS